MRKLKKTLLRLRIARDVHGQDLIEYALLAGMLAVAAGAVFPGIHFTLRDMFARVLNVLNLKLDEQG